MGTLILCPECFGSGSSNDGRRPCPICKGSGYKMSRKEMIRDKVRNKEK